MAGCPHGVINRNARSEHFSSAILWKSGQSHAGREGSPFLCLGRLNPASPRVRHVERPYRKMLAGDASAGRSALRRSALRCSSRGPGGVKSQSLGSLAGPSQRRRRSPPRPCAGRAASSLPAQPVWRVPFPQDWMTAEAARSKRKPSPSPARTRSWIMAHSVPPEIAEPARIQFAAPAVLRWRADGPSDVPSLARLTCTFPLEPTKWWLRYVQW
jgi:hypothetical protein